MKRTTLLISVIAILATTGCATGRPGDFWDGVRVTRSDESFYQGHYIGTEPNCFPPIENRECVPLRKGEVLYSADRQLEMESFYLFIASDFFGQPLAKEKLYFAAAELGLSRGFRAFTVTKTFDLTTCSDGLEATTTGVLTPSPSGHGGSYAGSTTVRQSGRCLNSQGVVVLYFRNKEDLSSGVLVRRTTGANQRLYPVTSLYFGTIPNLRYQDFNYESRPGSFTMTPDNAWKVHYNAAGLSEDFRKKFGLTSPPPILFRDEARENSFRDAEDPVERNRVVNQ